MLALMQTFFVFHDHLPELGLILTHVNFEKKINKNFQNYGGSTLDPRTNPFNSKQAYRYNEGLFLLLSYVVIDYDFE